MRGGNGNGRGAGPRTLRAGAAFLAGFGFAESAPAAQEAAPRRGIAAEDLERIREVREARVSPDGTMVVFVVSRVDLARDAYDTDLWVVPTEGGEVRRLTTSEAEDEQPRWSPDGKAIAFVSKRSGTSQVWILPTEGGEARPLTDREGGATNPIWSPDGTRIAFLGKVLPGGGKGGATGGESRKEPEKGARETDEQGRLFAKDVRVIDRLVYRRGTAYFDGSRTHLFVVPAAGGEPRAITAGDFDVRDPAWSPSDDSWIAFVANRRGDPDLDRNDDVWVVPVEGGDPRLLTPNVGPDRSPCWSPDGKWIAWVAATAPHDLKAQDDLFLAPVEGGEPRNLTAAFDRIPTDPQFAPDGASVFFRAADRGNVHVFSAPAAGGEVRRVVAGDRFVQRYHLSRHGPTIVFVASDPMNPSDIFLAARDGTGEKRLTEGNRDLLASVALSKPEEVRAKSFDGREIHGWVLRPPQFDPSRKHPMVLYVHGGPYSQYGNVWFHEFQVLASRGFVVLYANPRLSTGYGEDFVRAGGGEWGGPVYRDLMAITDHVVSLGFVDPQRLGVAGGSFGGYMATWIVGWTDRFRAAVIDRCVSDLLSFWGTTDIPLFVEREFGGLPWDNLDRLRDQSPITWLANAKTPSLIVAGELDWRTPIGQSEQVFAALRRRGVPAKLVRYPREGHDLSRNGEPLHRIDRLNRIADWFAEHLRPEKRPADAAPASAPVDAASSPPR